MTSVDLAVYGILQFKRTSNAPTIVEPGLGQVVYTGFEPTVATPALPVTVVTPGLGQVLYTGFIPTVSIVAPFTLTFTSEQLTSVGDTPWRINYYVYDNTLTLRYTVTHNLNRGATPPVSSATLTRTFPSFDPYYIDVQVQRMTETFGTPPRNNRTNDAGNVEWTRDGITENLAAFLINKTFNQYYPFTGIDTGTEFGVTIYEG